MKEKIVTEFLHDIVRKQNLDIHMRNNSNDDWDGYFHPDQDPWSDIGLTQSTVDWMSAQVERRERRVRILDRTYIIGGGPF